MNFKVTRGTFLTLRMCPWSNIGKFSTSSSSCLDQNWRSVRELPENPNRERVLLDLPDYSFVDGRPVPYGSRQLQRIRQQRQYTAKIMELTSEMDLAVKLNEDKQQKKRKEQEWRIKRKLKEKGDRTLE